jgi:GTP-binding protein HflX
MTLIDRSVRERIVVVGVVSWPRTLVQVEEDLEELGLLVDTAGADVVGTIIQRRARLDPATYLGRGKAEELAELCEGVDADTVVFDDELSPAQQRNLEKILGRTAIDRTAVILDIFAQNAKSEEGKCQVELALLQYRLPRLRGSGATLSQQAGRIGTRGPGETKLEVDRRRLTARIARLQRELRELESTRHTQRRGRERGLARRVSLVGYTNAGKSSVLNALTDAQVLVENRLFATLDPRTRRLDLPGGERVLIADTVGFVRRLPHQVVEAFHSTLEEVAEADLIVHVVDSSTSDPEGQIAAVHKVLEEIGAASVPELFAFNKVDLDREATERLAERHPVSVVLSAVTHEGLGDLLAAIADQLRVPDVVVSLVIPVERGDLLARLHRDGEILSEEDRGGQVLVSVRLEHSGLGPYRGFFERGEAPCDVPLPSVEVGLSGGLDAD